MRLLPVVLSGVPHATSLSVFASSIGCEEDFETIRKRIEFFAGAGCVVSTNILLYLNRENLGSSWKSFREATGLPLKPRLGIQPTSHRNSQQSGAPRSIESIDFQVAFSYSGKQRSVVSKIAGQVVEKLGEDQLFYDRFYQSETAQPRLDSLLHRIYKSNSTLIVAFLSEDYANSPWCREEWRLIRSIISHQNGASKIMPIRFDDHEIEGLLDTDGYVSVREYSIGEIVDFIVDRVAKRKSNPWKNVDFRFNIQPDSGDEEVEILTG